jgi:glycine dehydrogenase subunit 1
MSSGGPYFGFMACAEKLTRQMPGRIVGRTTDLDGKPGFALTLQAREQHIRRSKATSNICTNQGLMVTAATIYLSLMGAEGLRRVALTSCARMRTLLEKLTSLDGVSAMFEGQVFHEAVLRLPCPAASVLPAMASEGVLGGYDLSELYPELGDALLVCATETKTEADLDTYRAALARALAKT